MNQTETQADRSTGASGALSGALFDEVLVPVADARVASGAAPYFPAWRDAAAATYFERSSVGTMSPADFEFPGGGTAAGLIDAIAAYWLAQGETALAAAAPRLKAIAEALRAEAVADDGSVDIFCYTLF